MSNNAVSIHSYHRGPFSSWDYLVILDACRYDVFSEVVSEFALPGKLIRADTDVTNTSAWYKKHWSAEYTDAVLITANPWSFKGGTTNNAHSRFKRAIWADPEGKDVKGDAAIRERILPLCRWNEGFGVFHPRIALEVLAAYKEQLKQRRRYVVHLIPPHLPFIGEEGQALFRRLNLSSHIHGGIYRHIRNYGRRGNWDELRKCYKESIVATLRTLASYVKLFDDGRFVISSDHGELIGEPKFDSEGVYWHKPSGDT